MLILLRGIPGIGKSSFVRANELEPYTIEPDRVRLLFRQPVEAEDGSLSISQEDNNEVWELVNKLIDRRLERHEHIVLDAQNISVDRYVEMAKKYNEHILVIQFPNELERALQQNADREDLKKVPDDVIKSSSERMQPLQDIEGVLKVVSVEDFVNNRRKHEEESTEE